VLLVAFLLAGGGMYYELVYERQAAQKKKQQLDPMEEEVGEVLLGYLLPALVVSVVGGSWLLRRSLKPLDQLTQAAERIHAGNLREALPRTFNGDEVDRLSEVLNAMNQRVSAAMTEIHEFTLHASHELKTPLAVLHTEIETALAKTNSSDQRELLGNQLEEIQRLARIVEGLGLLARSNSGQMNYAHEPVAFHEVVQDTAEDATILGRSRGIVVELKALDESWVNGDRDRLRQMLLNLVDNAIKYNSEGGMVVIALRARAESIELEISNTGHGVEAKDLPHIFKKFYRAAGNSQAGDPGGIGLGLSIVQAIAQAHAGEVAFDSGGGSWTTVRVRVPQMAKVDSRPASSQNRSLQPSATPAT
jgi:signal transduction histidine kinase